MLQFFNQIFDNFELWNLNIFNIMDIVLFFHAFDLTNCTDFCIKIFTIRTCFIQLIFCHLNFCHLNYATKILSSQPMLDWDQACFICLSTNKTICILHIFFVRLCYSLSIEPVISYGEFGDIYEYRNKS